MPEHTVEEERGDKLARVLDVIFRYCGDVRDVDEEEQNCDEAERDVSRATGGSGGILRPDLAENCERVEPAHEGEVDFDDSWFERLLAVGKARRRKVRT